MYYSYLFCKTNKSTLSQNLAVHWTLVFLGHSLDRVFNLRLT
jgi:hypothetical protein